MVGPAKAADDSEVSAHKFFFVALAHHERMLIPALELMSSPAPRRRAGILEEKIESSAVDLIDLPPIGAYNPAYSQDLAATTPLRSSSAIDSQNLPFNFSYNFRFDN
jgi:hypothetical protein